MTNPKIFFLHALGASADEWREVMAHLDTRYDCVALDLPGFGQEPLRSCTDVDALVDWFCSVVVGSATAQWLVVGHSMGAKIATVAAARAARGDAGLAGLVGVVLLAGSPPSPEPMDEARRQEMLSWAHHPSISRTHAAEFISANTSAILDDVLKERAICDVMRSDPRAWRAWLEHGSREDWAEQVGTLAFPVCIVAGQEDGDLGEQAQRELNQPHFAAAEQIQVVADAAHLLPYEQPEQIATAIGTLANSAFSPALPSDFLAVLNAARTDRRMRARLIARNLPPNARAASVLGSRALMVLASMCALVVDQVRGADELARRIDIGLAAGEGDGWRFAELPPDPDAWSAGLACLDAVAGGFCERPAHDQVRLLQQVQRGELVPSTDCALDQAQLRLWFEDACAQIVRVWTSLPATMAQMGYDGFAIAWEGDIARGFEQTGQDQVEVWQLRAGRA